MIFYIELLDKSKFVLKSKIDLLIQQNIFKRYLENIQKYC
jgi:hypothetical protein